MTSASDYWKGYNFTERKERRLIPRVLVRYLATTLKSGGFKNVSLPAVI